MSLTVGYTFIYWSRVVQAGNQVNTTVSMPDPNTGVQTSDNPQFRFHVPPRAKETEYRQAVSDWHAARAVVWADAMFQSPGRDSKTSEASITARFLAVARFSAPNPFVRLIGKEEGRVQELSRLSGRMSRQTLFMWLKCSINVFHLLSGVGHLRNPFYQLPGIDTRSIVNESGAVKRTGLHVECPGLAPSPANAIYSEPGSPCLD